MTAYLYTTETSLLLQVKADLERHEGFKEWAYPDPLSFIGKKYKSFPWGNQPARELLARIGNANEKDGAPWTVGFGFTNGVTPDSTMNRITAERKLEGLILEMNNALSTVFTWYKGASFVTKTIIINMAFNMGLKTLLSFKNTLAAVAAKQYVQAANGMANSLWYKQTGLRAKELVQRMSTQTIEAANKAKESIQ